MLELKIFIDEGDMYGGKPLAEHIMRYFMHHEIRGATIFAALAGYGHKHHLHSPKQIGNVDEAPLLIMAIDDEEKILKILPHIKDVIEEGLIVTSRVDEQ
ncbi:MAG TPA: DUF190 domain-containing protein [Bacteroidota bacterium]|nr:DUF190 domain-containing protein [Bacteroidota bacterium]